MSGERLGEVRARIAATRQLETVFTAMRGLAAARSREAQQSLEGVRAYAHALGETIGVALALAPDERTARAPATRHIVLAFCAEQGFVGGFDRRVLDAASRAGARSALYIVGQKGFASADELGMKAAWSAPMIAHAADAPLLAERIAGKLYATVSGTETVRVTLVHGAPSPSGADEIVARPLIPLDLTRFPVSGREAKPLVNLPPAELIATLAEEYIFAELCEAALLSFAAENMARMMAMTAARSNVRKTIDDLVMRHRRLRQEQITEELVELSRP
ncbi:MAG: H(+)-transporting ATPase [Hyphomicrobiales bacterium]|nr:MAG: H(+)-transporting ATPase [Hyphomicrobiales bacterium]